MFQSTRPRGARHCRFAKGNVKFKVSIHAPARGATYGYDDYNIAKIVSIHAPARGATR